MHDKYKSGNWEYDNYIRSEAWRKKRDERLKLDNYTCCVCGGRATEVHHLTYEHFKDEKMEDLVSLCHGCHVEAENLYDPAVTPWTVKKSKNSNFMAAMRVDACTIAPVVFNYLIKVRGSDLGSLLILRQPEDPSRKDYWNVLKKAVNALCRKRYSLNGIEDRRDIVLEAMNNRVEAICLSHIEHYARTSTQALIQQRIEEERKRLGKLDAVAEEYKEYGISITSIRNLRSDDGTSFGPSLREIVLYHCALDAAAGIRPLDDFKCLTDTDYETLNCLADYMIEVSGTGAFKGE